MTRQAISSPWAEIEEKSEELKCNIGQQLKEVEQGKYLFHKNKGLESHLRKQLDADINRLGLRKLVRIEKKVYRFTCQQAVSED